MMEEVFEFIKVNWTWMIEVLTLLIVTLVTIFKKKVKVISDIKGQILEVLPSFIASVEAPGNGPTKMKEVIDMTTAFLERIYPGIQVKSYISFIRKSVEAILSTPEKKAR